MLTQGNRGLSYKQRSKKILWLPPATTNSKDTIGAGDAAFSFASCFIKNSKNGSVNDLLQKDAKNLNYQKKSGSYYFV